MGGERRIDPTALGYQELLLVLSGGEQAALLEDVRPGGQDRPQTPAPASQHVGPEPVAPEALERRGLAAHARMHDQQSPAGTQVGRGLVADPVDQRTPVAAGVPRARGAAPR
jgi:hypothetical protein